MDKKLTHAQSDHEIVRTINELLISEVNSLLEIEKQYIEFLHSSEESGQVLWGAQSSAGRKIKELVLGYFETLFLILPPDTFQLLLEENIETSARHYPYGGEIIVDLQKIELYDVPKSSGHRNRKALTEEQWFWNGQSLISEITNRISALAG